MRGLGGILAWVAAAVLLAPISAASEEAAARPKHGLMWHSSGLPAVFPLQVKSNAGRNYYLTLTNIESSETVLAAFVIGGRFFRVLVPPGTFNLRLDYGVRWQDEEALFGEGDKTGAIELEEPLTFSISGLAKKNGYIVDLTGDPEDQGFVTVRLMEECQRIRVARFPRPLPPFGEDAAYASRLTEEGVIVRHPSSGYDPERDTRSVETDSPVVPTRHAPYFSQPAFEVRTVPCP